MTLRTEIPHFPRRLAFDTFRRMVGSGGWLIIGGTECQKPVGGFEKILSTGMTSSTILLETGSNSFSTPIGFIRLSTPWHIEIISSTIREHVLFHLVHLPKLAKALE